VRTVVVNEQGAQIALKGGELVVSREKALLARVRLAEIAQVVAMGSIELTSAARAELLKRGIDTVFLTQRGQYRGRLVGAAHGNVELRIAQYRRLLDPLQAGAAARAIVRGKLVNQRRLLQRFQARRPDKSRAAAIVKLSRLEERCAVESDVAVIRGLEGMGAAEYFAVFGTLLTNSEFSFAGRNRRPPRDPVNALLSFGYALLQTVVEGAVYRAGLDPHLGALHAPRHGAATLVFDLMEEFRPLFVDSLVLDLVNHRAVGPGDFHVVRPETNGGDVLAAEEEESPDPEGGAGTAADAPGVLLDAAGRKIILQAFFRRLRRDVLYAPRAGRYSGAQIVVEQAYHFARWLRGETPEYIAHQPR